MAKTSKKAGEQTRKRILECALPLFAKHGFAGTSTRMIASAADVNIATLPYYFGDKAGLYAAVLERMQINLVEEGPKAMIIAGSPSETIDALVDGSWIFVTSHKSHLQLLLRHVLDTDENSVNVQRWNEPLMQQADVFVGAFRPEWPSSHRRMVVLVAMHSLVRLVVEDERQLKVMLKDADHDEAITSYFKAFLKRELGITTP